MWNIAERAQRKAREAMDKKKDRGAGKVVNFCVAGGTGIVIRKNGKVLVKNIEDLVREGVFEAWDGAEWVTTQAVDRGWQTVIKHQSGLTATPDHIVWTESGPMTLLEATIQLETLLGQDEMGRYEYGTAPPVLEAGDVPQDVYERRALVRDIMLFGYNGTSSHRRDTYDKYGIGLPSCPVQNLAQAAGLLALILPSTLCYDLVDCGPHHRFATVYGLVHNSSSYGGQASSLQRKIEADTGHQVPLEMVEAMLQAIVDRAPRADEFFHEMEEKPFKAGFIRAASGRLRHCTAFGSEGEKLSKRTRDGAVSALGRECRNFPMQESVGAVASLALQNTLAFKERFSLEGGVVVCLYDSLVVHCPYHERMIWAEALEVFMHLANGWAYGNNLLRYSIDLEFNAGWSTHSPDREWNDNMKDPAFEPVPDRLKPAMDYILALKDFYTKFPEASVYNKEDLVQPLNYIG